MKGLFIKNKKLRWLLLSLGIVVAICVALIIYKNWIPTWVNWQEKEITFSKDDCTTVTLTLSGKKFVVRNSNGAEIYKSDERFKIQDVITTDIDRDGKEEIITVLWKKGIYGKHRPFWVESDEDTYSQHIFLYRFDQDGKIVSMWCASDTGILVKRIKVFEKNSRIIMCEDISGEVTMWNWDSWGLKQIDSEVSFIAFGDNLIHEAIYGYANRNENGNFDFLYKDFKDEISSADIAALNAETVLVDKKSMVSGYPSFGSPVEVGEAVADAGFDIAVCGNNHIMDKGIQSLDYTIDFYKSKEILCPGVQKSTDTEYKPYELISKKGIKFAIFSYTYGTNIGDVSEKYPYVVHYLPKTEQQEKEMVADLQKAREEADFIIVFVHWGEEYSKEVTKEQRAQAALLAEGGADLIIGSHPHVVQKTETIKRSDGGETLIYYSLGNFRANQWESLDTRTGAEARVVICHTWDGAIVKNYETKVISAYWK